MLRLTRRHALWLGTSPFLGGPLWGASRARAIGPSSLVDAGLIVHDGNAHHRPDALRRMLWETGRRTSIDVARDKTDIRLDEEALFQHPLLVLTGAGPLPPFGPRARARLALHLRYGGLLYIDAPAPDDPFATGASALVASLFGDEALKPLAKDNVLFRSFFLLGDGVSGRTLADRNVYGVEKYGRTLVIMTRCDVLGAHERDRLGSWRFDCEPGGERQREQALRFGVNLFMYATCLDYKADQVHIPFIMKKRRR